MTTREWGAFRPRGAAPLRTLVVFGSVLTIVLAAAACSDGGGSGETAIPSTTVDAVAVSTTVAPTTTQTPSILPPEGTIPLAQLGEAGRTDDLLTSAKRALEAWTAAPEECFASRAEAVAARDQFARVATYLAGVRSALRELGSLAAFKQIITVEATHRSDAATRRFVICGAPESASAPQTSTTVAGGSTKGLVAGGVAEVDLTVTGTPTMDQEFTIADLGAPCDGIGANTTFLVNSRDPNGRWVISDVIVDATGATSAAVIPTRAGPGAIEYLAYCGTEDKRHGVATFNVRTTGDTTTTAPVASTSDPDAQESPLVVVDLPADDSTIIVDPLAGEVAVEPASVTAFLLAKGTEGGVALARLNGGDWVALRENEVTWIPVGPGDSGLETQVVGAKTPLETTIRVVAPSTTTTSTVAQTTTSITAPVTTDGSERDDTLIVVIVLVAFAAVSVLVARLRLRRH